MTKRNFRIIVILSLLSLFVSGAVVDYYKFELPEQLNLYLEAEYKKGISLYDLVGVFAAIFTFASSVGLLFFLRWSRPTFVAAVIASLASILFSGPLVATSHVAFMYGARHFVDGIIISLLYFSEIKVYFETNTHNQQHNTDSDSDAPPPVR